MSGLRLLFVFNNPAFFISHRLPVALAARRAGFEVHVATPPGPAADQIVAQGFYHHPIPLNRGGMNPVEELLAAWSIFRLLGELAPDIVELATIKPILYGSFASRLRRDLRVVHWVTGLGHIFSSDTLLARLVRPIVIVMYRIGMSNPRSLTIFENAENRAVLVRARTVDVRATRLVPGAGVDMQEFQLQPEQARRPVVMLAARMLWAKGVGEFVAAATELRAQGVEADFVLVGEPDPGNPESVAAEQLRTWEERGVVQWWGQQSGMAAVLAKCTIFCLPSHAEGVPRVLIEAAAVGRPLVATDIAGCRTVVHDRVNGILVPPRDARALADAIRSLLASPDLRRRMAIAGRELVAEQFSVETIADQTLKVYSEALRL